MIRIDNYKVYNDLTKEELFNGVLNKNKIDRKDLIDIKIVKKSIDARDKRNVYYNYSAYVLISVNDTVRDRLGYCCFHIIQFLQCWIKQSRKTGHCGSGKCFVTGLGGKFQNHIVFEFHSHRLLDLDQFVNSGGSEYPHGLFGDTGER